MLVSFCASKTVWIRSTILFTVKLMREWRSSQERDKVTDVFGFLHLSIQPWEYNFFGLILSSRFRKRSGSNESWTFVRQFHLCIDSFNKNGHSYFSRPLFDATLSLPWKWETYKSYKDRWSHTFGAGEAQTSDLRCRKQPLCQLCHNQCPQVVYWDFRYFFLTCQDLNLK